MTRAGRIKSLGKKNKEFAARNCSKKKVPN